MVGMAMEEDFKDYEIIRRISVGETFGEFVIERYKEPMPVQRMFVCSQDSVFCCLNQRTYRKIKRKARYGYGADRSI